MPVYEERIWLHADKRLCFLQNNSDAPKTLVAPHWHEGYEILYIRRGWGEQRINAQVLPFHLGEIVVICPGDIHATEALAPKGCEIDVVHCSEDLLDAYESKRAALTSGVLEAQGEGFEQLFNAIGRYARDTQPGQPLLMAGFAQLLLGALVRSARQNAAPHCSPMIREICDDLRTAETLSLEQTAKRFGYTPEHLSRKFRAETGVPFHQYCEKLRMRRAAALLQNGPESLAEIADRLGYCSASSFIRAFKRAYGMTPHAYRRTHFPLTGHTAE